MRCTIGFCTRHRFTYIQGKRVFSSPRKAAEHLVKCGYSQWSERFWQIYTGYPDIVATISRVQKGGKA